MLIRSKLIRAGGTEVVLGKGKDARHYHFKPTDPSKPGEDHACDVSNQDDIATLLAIKEGYEVHPSEVKSRVPPAAPKAVPPTEPAPPQATPPQPAAKPGRTKAELIAAVIDKTGKKPHPSTSTAKLESILAE